MPDLDTIDAAAWDRACDEVAASILSDQVRKTGRIFIDPEVLGQAMRARLPQAKAELGDHQADVVTCRCRHHAIINVGACQQAQMSGARQDLIFDGALAVLDGYLARRS